MQSVTGDQAAGQCRHSKTFLPECSTKSDIWPDIWPDIFEVLCYQSFFCALLVLTGFDVNDSPSVLPNVVQYWRCACRVNTLQFYSDKAQNLLSKLHEHCLIRFALYAESGTFAVMPHSAEIVPSYAEFDVHYRRNWLHSFQIGPH